jgi:hypothetical protein
MRHVVKDFDVWKLSFDEHAAAREQYGIHVGGLFRDAAKPHRVVLVIETDDIDRAREFFEND